MAAPTTALPTGTVTFLLTDIEGSTRHWERDADTMQQAVARHYEIAHRVVSGHGGVLPEEQGEGDSFVAAFRTATDATRAAVDAQLAFEAEPWPTPEPVCVRMAINTGEARLRDPRNYAGETIIRTARLRSLAAGRQILASRSTVDAVGSTAEIGFAPLGEVRLKDLSRREHVFQVTHPSLHAEFAPVRGVESFPNNLPVQLSTFVGCEAALAQVHALVEDVRLLTLTGSGGCGKTRLALQVAADRLTMHPDGLWYVELAPLGDDSSILLTLAGAMGLHLAADQDPLDTIVDELAHRSVMLVVDNCEHLLDGAGRAIGQLLERLPTLVVLATSRQPLNLPGETTWRVPSLAVPSVSVDVRQVSQYDAVRLFVDRAVHARPDFQVTNDNVAAVASVCSSLDGIPLAIELAAARVRSMPVQRIDAALTDRFRLLSGGSPTLHSRQQTLRASVDWSHEMLDERQRVVFRRLSQFSGGFDLGAAEAVAADPAGDIDAYDVFDVLADLVERSLVIFDAADDRYRLLETMKQFGDEQLTSCGEVVAVRERHAEHFRSVAEAAAPLLETGEQVTTRERLDADRDNLRLALDWWQTHDSDAMGRMAVDLVFYWLQTGRFHEGVDWLGRTIATADGTVTGARARWGVGYLTFYFGDFDRADGLAEEAIAAGRAVDDPRTVARSIDLQADVTQLVEPLAGVEPLLGALRIADSIEDTWGRSDIMQKIGFSHLFAERPDDAVEWFERARVVWEPTGNQFFASWHESAMAWIEHAAGDSGATASADLARHWGSLCGDPNTEGFAVWYQTVSRIRFGRVDEAQSIVAATREEFERRRVGGIGPAVVDVAQGAIDIAIGEPVAGVARIRPAVEGMRVEGATVPEVAWSELLIEGLWCAGDIGAVDELVARLSEAADELDAGRWRGLANQFAAAVALERGDPAGAMRHITDAFDAWGSGYEPARSSTLRLAAWAHAMSGDPDTAVVLLSAAERNDDHRGWAVPPHVGSWARAARELLAGESEPDPASSVYDLDGAIAHALRGRGSRLRPSTGWLSLTPTERSVADAVAEGLSNPAVGERLFISRSTVKTHLSHIFTKLDISSRAELAAIATRHGDDA